MLVNENTVVSGLFMLVHSALTNVNKQLVILQSDLMIIRT